MNKFPVPAQGPQFSSPKRHCDLLERTPAPELGSGRLTASDQVLSALMKASGVGCAMLDADLRYCFINKSLARMNGIPAEAHLGKSISEVLGHFADSVRPKLRYVLESGQALLNLSVSAQLSNRDEIGSWTEDYFPIKSPAGLVTHILAIVLETPKHTETVASIPVEHRVHGSATVPKGNESGSGNRILRSWKEIANYTNASIRTVQRWESEFALPIRRLRSKKGMLIMAFSQEIDGWLHSRARSTD